MTRLAVGCMLLLAVTATNGGAALVVGGGDPNYIGSVVLGVPAGEADEEGYINTLIGRTAGSADAAIGGQTYNRVGSTLNTAGFPAADFGAKEEPTDGTIDVTGYTYLLGKFGGGSTAGTQISYVWYVGNLTGAQTIEDTKALSHISLFTQTSTGVPDGGVPLMLLGGALAGIEALRRKVNL